MRRGTIPSTIIFLVLCLFIGTWFGLFAANLDTLQPVNRFTRQAMAGLGIPVTNHGLRNAKELRELLEETKKAELKPIIVTEIMQPSVVHIQTSVEQPRSANLPEHLYRHFRIPRPGRGGQASGVIVDEDGTILTNNHAVANAKNILVKLHDERVLKARLIGADPRTDPAVIKIDAPDLIPAKLGDSGNMFVAEKVLAFGNPFGLSHTVTEGIVSAKGRANVGIADLEDFIQTDAAINPGNSGGPLVNMRAEVIGINTAILSNTGSYSGIGFAIPINMARSVMEQLIEFGKVTRGYLGISASGLTPRKMVELGLTGKRGALVVVVAPGSPAETAELKPDDLIVEFDGKRIEDVASLKSAVALTDIGKKIEIKFIRNKEEITAEVTIVQEPQSETYSDDIFGLVVQHLDDKLRRHYHYARSVEGVVIVEVKPDSIFRRSYMSEGVVITLIKNLTQHTNIVVRTIDDYKEAVEAADGADEVRIEFRFGSRKGALELTIP